MKNVLYIYGYGSNENSGTRQSLQNVLGSNYKVESIYYEQLQPNEAIEYLSNYVENNNFAAVIGSSLGGFYALSIWQPDIPTIVINPCMKPSIELPKIGCPAEIAARFKDFEKWDNVKNVKKKVFGLFGTDDELIDYHCLFGKLFGTDSFSFFSSSHRPTENQLLKVKDLIEKHI